MPLPSAKQTSTIKEVPIVLYNASEVNPVVLLRLGYDPAVVQRLGKILT